MPAFAVRGPLFVFGNLTAGCLLAGRGGSRGYDCCSLGNGFALARCGYRWLLHFGVLRCVGAISGICSGWAVFERVLRVLGPMTRPRSKFCAAGRVTWIRPGDVMNLGLSWYCCACVGIGSLSVRVFSG